MSELKQMLQKSNNSADGPDEVHYNLLTHLPESVLSAVLKVYNSTWESGPFPPMEISTRGSHSQRYQESHKIQAHLANQLSL